MSLKAEFDILVLTELLIRKEIISKEDIEDIKAEIFGKNPSLKSLITTIENIN